MEEEIDAITLEDIACYLLIYNSSEHYHCNEDAEDLWKREAVEKKI